MRTSMGAGCVFGFFLISTLLGPSPARAENTRFFTLESFGQFLDGNPESTAVTEDGAVTLPPATREWLADAAAVYSAATARGDEVLLARGDDGQVLAVDRAGKTRKLFKSGDSLVTAILATAKGTFVALASPGKIMRLDDKGGATLFNDPDAGFVWAMVAGPEDSILAATGEPGRVIRIDNKGKSTVLFEPDQAHMRALAYDPELGIFAGGGQRGVLYRAADNKTFRALYDTNHPEVTAIVVRDAFVYAAGVTGAEALASADSSEEKGKKGGPEVRSQLAQVGMDGSAEIIAGSNDEAVFALGLDDQRRILVATGATGRDDPRGRLYAVEPKRREISMVYQAPSRRITHLCSLPRGATAAIAADGGRVIALSGGVAAKGEFLTLPFDTGINSRIGTVAIFGEIPKGTKASVAVRTGQTNQPDDSWSSWSNEVVAPGGQRANAVNGRFLQLRITLNGTAGQTPSIYRVRVAYLRQNLPPFVREVVALRKGLALSALPAELPKSKTISLAEKADKDAQHPEEAEAKTPPRSTQARQIEERGALTIKWLAEDPNGDELAYDLSYRRVGKPDWHLMAKQLEVPFLTIQAAQLPDGHYQFRVRASDAPGNPDGLDLFDNRESRTILVDNTPPSIDPLQVTVAGRRAVIRTVAADSVGPLVRADYSVDGQPFRPVVPDDGVLDGAGESFTIRLGELGPGSHTVTFRVADEAENESVGEAHVEIR